MESKDVYYHRNLPYMHPEGYPLFITFRLADSLPLEVLRELQEQREYERKTLKNSSNDELYKIERKHFGRYDEWLDHCETGPRWLEEMNIATIVADKIHSMKDLYFPLLAFCIMPNHVHLLIDNLNNKELQHGGKTAKYPITDTLRLLKGNTARTCNLALGRGGRFWNHESYDHYVRSESELERIIKYILHNPVKAGLVEDWTTWQFTYISPKLGSW